MTMFVFSWREFAWNMLTGITSTRNIYLQWMIRYFIKLLSLLLIAHNKDLYKKNLDFALLASLQYQSHWYWLSFAIQPPIHNKYQNLIVPVWHFIWNSVNWTLQLSFYWIIGSGTWKLCRISDNGWILWRYLTINK